MCFLLYFNCQGIILPRNDNQEEQEEDKDRKKDQSRIGQRLDAIVKTDDDAYYEYGVVEVAKTFRGMKSTKWLTDNLKLAKALHDMLVRLELLVDNRESLVKKLQVVGLVNSGLKCQVLQMNHPNGCVSHRTSSAVRSSYHRRTSTRSFQVAGQHLANEKNDKRLRSCFQQPSHVQDGSRAVHRVDAEWFRVLP
ncbi:hypothetical protein BC936DRAFT_146528 [Jimgerdemannia flammicorona]|uniref:Uncharacterized protein n=1 Tax=Jimgerdemannia flammicorona TaxID=994334 RepID=A0A433D7F2_9FUNG|nr:hypothetical protein BC936DRAFT_146528 [Jimgerdemannia flammicorona]